ncbi:GntR family transcriptional regulator [Amycolatopsis sp.]|uniref:GntR family transcriptional regulator n=1 Tax=Amycolatopsis sp. TaxID=37632 RepID=UPI002B8F322D|nr:GntR family transcriptional regulator [Amycolatopsis sp.]HVV10829.1 GntR family transcriptional regulator [Amycolatopsis sp.]
MPGTAKAAVSGREKAYQFLKRTVLADPELEGAFVSEQDVAEQVGVSRTPVREALLQLASEELVQLVPNRGAYIAPLSGRDLRELFELRGVLERYAAQRAIETGNVPVAELQAAMEQQKRFEDPAHAKEFIEFDHLFHSVLVDSVGNSMLSKTYASLRARQMRAGLTALSRSSDRQERVLAEHYAIFKALELGAVSTAIAAIDHHHTTTLNTQLTAT